jgi:hypothetical protein
VKRTASAPNSAIASSGSITLPRVLDIFSPADAHEAVKVHDGEGRAAVKWIPAMIMRATQKKRMS